MPSQNVLSLSASILKIFVFAIVLAVSCVVVNGQSQPPATVGLAEIHGMPRIIHYTKKEFNSDPQFWAMCQDAQGVLYFGNNDGVLIYDGERWQKVTLPNNSSVRSLRTSKKGEIYAGGFNELGTIKRDRYGKYYYESLLELLRPEDRNLENIWQIYEVQGYIVFRSTRMLIAIANNKAITLPSSESFRYCNVINDQLYVQDKEWIKQVDLRSLEFTDLVHQREINSEEIVGLLPGLKKEGLLLITKKGSAYAIDPEKRTATFRKRLIPENSSNLIICAIKSKQGTYYLGTLSTKIMLLNESGEHVTTSEAFQNLQDNTVLNLFESREGNIWALLNNGLDCIDVSSPVSMLFDNAAIFDVLPVGKTLYVATNQGVFISNNPNGDNYSRTSFRKIEGLEGQAWSLQYFKGIVICSHDRGIFILTGNGIQKIPDITGIWKIIEVNDRPDDFLVCTYEGLHLLHYDKAKGFVLQHRIEGFRESSRDILQSNEPGIFWVCHGYKGVFRIKVDESLARTVSLEHFKDQNGLPSPFNINVFRWKGETVFTTNKGIFTFDATANRFEPHALLTSLFGTEHNVRKLLQHGDKTWFVHDDEAGYFLTNEAKPVLEKGLFLNLKGTFNQSMECIVPLSNKNVLMGTITGLYAFDLSYNSSEKALANMLITKVSAQEKQEEVLGDLTNATLRLQLSNQTSSIRFDFAAPDFQDQMNIQYSYRLEAVDANWSEWQETPYKEFSYLRSGRYAFHVKARSLLGESSREAVYYFEILPAWYQTVWAYIVYSLLATFIVITVAGMVKRKINLEKQKTRDEEEKKRKVLELEIQQIKLKQEKEQMIKDKAQLEEDVIHKSKELANYTMLLVKKRELLSDMHDELKTLKDTVRSDASKQIVRDLIRKINTNLQNEEHIQVFEANFERVHHEFFAQLKSTFSDLTQKELQLCAFVRMNLTNKEIASILNISVRGVETARYRLRKRLGMSHEQDMSAFLEKLYASNEKSPDIPDDSSDLLNKTRS
jgi:DNA-binding CsgD family transcriptional regulator/ligand-binding sensor domain-containing protein